MRILLDMNLSPAWCAVLGRHGHACVHWSDVGDPRADDGEVMAWARREGYVVLTHDLDFGTILAVTRAIGPSVVQIRTQDILPVATETLLTGILTRYQAELSAGALVVVNRARARVRVLPISRR